jgi:tetratricopeptide (TPR) repeat protein
MRRLWASVAGLLITYVVFVPGTFAGIAAGSRTTEQGRAVRDQEEQLKQAEFMVAQLESRKFEDAVETAKIGLRSYPDNNIFWYVLGSAELQLHHYTEAIEALNETIRLDESLNEELSPGTVATKWRSLGDAYLDSGNVEESISAYKQAVAADKDEARTWNNLSIAYGKLRRDEDAISAALEAVRIEPDKLPYLNNLAVAFLKADRFDDGLTSLQQALKLKPDDALTLYHLGGLFAAYGHRKNAEDVYETLQKLDPALAKRYFMEVLLPRN